MENFIKSMNLDSEPEYQFQTKFVALGNNQGEETGFENIQNNGNIAQIPESLLEDILHYLILLDIIDEDESESPRKLKRTDSEKFLLLGAQVNLQQTQPIFQGPIINQIPFSDEKGDSQREPKMDVSIFHSNIISQKTSWCSNNDAIELPCSKNACTSEHPTVGITQPNNYNFQNFHGETLSSERNPSTGSLNELAKNDALLSKCSLEDKPIDCLNTKRTKREKNRVSARECRQRKKEYLKNIESELIKVKHELDDCRKQLANFQESKETKKVGEINLLQQLRFTKDQFLAKAKEILAEEDQKTIMQDLIRSLIVRVNFY